MNDEALAKIICEEVINKGAEHYASILQIQNGLAENRPSQEEWTTALASLRGLDVDTKVILAILLRQACVDTASHILGILDGSSLLPVYREGFRLYYGDSESPLNGDLQTYFLAEQEGR